uniref:Uncharacterized protein n=1 Tax=Siphoviridae sp. ct5kv15 TaxID=2825338 RepID=A0A8S5PL70_9CAUD|nr:MAG TPA: hypothetical protein [Siphoviridae sp. ct5kv15]
MGQRNVHPIGDKLKIALSKFRRCLRSAHNKIVVSSILLRPKRRAAQIEYPYLDNIICLPGEPGDVLHPFRACRRWCQ